MEDLFLSSVCVHVFEFMCVYVYVPLKAVCVFFLLREPIDKSLLMKNIS